MIDLDKLRETIQARIDDASGDHYYCDPHGRPCQLPQAFGMHVAQDEETLARTIKLLGGMAVQCAASYRANANGGGRVVVALRTQDDGKKLECLVAVIKAADGMFRFYKNPPWASAAEAPR